MTQNPPSVDETNSLQENYASEFDREIAELEQTLSALKHRHADTQVAAQEQVVLTRQRNELKHKSSSYPEIKQELKLIRSRLAELDITLESRLLNEWRLMWEPFWQAVRFGGLGMAIGWVLANWRR
jgi:cytochrome c biogenesis factor